MEIAFKAMFSRNPQPIKIHITSRPHYNFVVLLATSVNEYYLKFTLLSYFLFDHNKIKKSVYHYHSI